MANSPFIGWGYPNQNDRNWYSQFQSLVNAQDASAYSAREDRGIFIIYESTPTFSGGTLSWTSNIIVVSPIAGYQVIISPGTLAVASGQFVYFNTVRSPTSNTSATLIAANTVPNTETACTFGVCISGQFYYRNPPVNIGGGDPDLGTGTDGTITFDGTSTILGIVPSGSVYTLTRSIYPANMTVNNGVTVNTASYQIFIQNILTNNGTISNNGSNGSAYNVAANGAPAGFYQGGGSGAVSGSAGGSSAHCLPAPWSSTNSTSNAGAAGAEPNGNGGSATLATAAMRGGGGGGGGANGSVNGGAGSAGGSTTIAAQSTFPPLSWVMDTGICTFTSGSVVSLTVGCGGAGGGADSSGTVYGGTGGGGGGVCYVAALNIVGTGNIQANGGNGQVGQAGTTGGASGGGGGGGGGIVWVKSSTISNTQTLTATGGTGGAGGVNGSGHGNGGAGSAGVNGLVFSVEL
jgi:hypothetical protein